MTRIARILRLRPRLLTAVAVAVTAFVLLPHAWRFTTRALVAWDLGALLYFALAGAMMARSSIQRMEERARAEDEGAGAVLAVTVSAAIASLFAIGAELSGIHAAPAGAETARLALVGVTILCSWLFVNLVFAIHYAHEFYGGTHPRICLVFPGEEHPDYWDFLYFAVTIGAAAQTSDVSVQSRSLRRLVLAQTVVAFLFNTTILALAINVGAGLLQG